MTVSPSSPHVRRVSLTISPDDPFHWASTPATARRWQRDRWTDEVAIDLDHRDRGRWRRRRRVRRAFEQRRFEFGHGTGRGHHHDPSGDNEADPLSGHRGPKPQRADHERPHDTVEAGAAGLGKRRQAERGAASKRPSGVHSVGPQGAGNSRNHWSEFRDPQRRQQFERSQ